MGSATKFWVSFQAWYPKKREFLMQKWYENKKLLNTFIFLMCISFVAYFFFHWGWGLPLFLCGGTAIMVRGVVKITMRMRRKKNRKEN